MLDAATCYRALLARDRRFDGRFYVGVTTTGIYCRPICPARTPARARCVFYRAAAEAERDGYRACLRCRPELAPGAADVDAAPRLVAAAVAAIEGGFLNERSADELAERLGVTGRHLRRAVSSALGVTPAELAQTRRLALAVQLVRDTDLSMTEVAFAAGFSSVRRLNATFRDRLGRPPSALRRARGARGQAPAEAVELRLEYRPPLDWDAMLAFLGPRAIPGVESVRGGAYRRSVRVGDRRGWIEIAPDGARPAVRARISPALMGALTPVVARIRALFDLDAHPARIADHLARSAELAPRVRARPGLRVPGAFDAFEVAVRAVLGQQVTVKGATTLAGRLVARLGTPIATPHAGVDRLFPTAAEVRARAADEIAAIGLPAARARTIAALAAAFSGAPGDAGDLAGAAAFGPAAADVEASLARLCAVPGVGPWTAEYLAMRALRWPDAFPASDLGLRKALGQVSARDALARAEAWRPWRSYAAMHLWTSPAGPA